MVSLLLLVKCFMSMLLSVMRRCYENALLLFGVENFNFYLSKKHAIVILQTSAKRYTSSIQTEKPLQFIAFLSSSSLFFQLKSSAFLAKLCKQFPPLTYTINTCKSNKNQKNIRKPNFNQWDKKKYVDSIDRVVSERSK